MIPYFLDYLPHNSKAVVFHRKCHISVDFFPFVMKEKFELRKKKAIWIK